MMLEFPIYHCGGVPRDENFKKDECVWTWGALGSQMQTKSARVIRVFRDEKIKKDECGQRGCLGFQTQRKKVHRAN